MSRRNTGRGVEEALRMLCSFASVGGCCFDLTRTDRSGNKCDYRARQSLERLCGGMAEVMELASRRQQNVIVRPHSGWATLVQLDDLCASRLERVRPAAFLVLATSPGNHQAWVAVRECGKETARRLRRGSSADPCASGATRVAGSVNYKQAYAPDFPTVHMVESRLQWTVSEAELEAAGLLAAPETMGQRDSPRVVAGAQTRRWPSYEQCLRNAPGVQPGDRPDVSRADFTFCLLAIDWGWSIEQTCQRLVEKSRKAQENGDGYARRTAEHAARAVDRRSGFNRTSRKPANAAW